MQNETLFKVFNEDNKEQAELFLHGPIRDPLPDEDPEDVIQFKEVRKKLNEITADKIIVHLNSTGGDMFQSVGIHNLLKAHEADIEIIVNALAASGGSVIAMAGDKIRMYKNSVMMIHSAHTVTYGNAEDHRDIAERLDKLDESLKENYKDRFTGSDEELKDLLKTETWLTAQEAKEKGFCDEIIDKESEEAEGVENMARRFKSGSQSSVKAKLLEKYTDQNSDNLFKKFN